MELDSDHNCQLVGKEMLQWAQDLFPFNRSITGQGVRDTLGYIKAVIPELQIREVPSGSEVFDWIVPPEWEITEGYIEDRNGQRIVDFQDHNLHIVGYSEAVDRWMSLEALQSHLHSIPDDPDAIPYVHAYYERTWGFCLAHSLRETLSDGMYHVVIRSRHFDGMLNYGELFIPGGSEQEILLSTYVCHPSMANNELSGPVLLAALARWLLQQKERRYSYRILFSIETIGTIAYLSRHLQQMRRNTVAGFVLTCVGDERGWSMVPSRGGKSYADKVMELFLAEKREAGEKVNLYTFLCRGSDERQYCSPGVDLPVVSFCRSRHSTYPEYHTSRDDFSVVTAKGLTESYTFMQRLLRFIAYDYRYCVTTPCEPHLSRHGLYPNLTQHRGENWWTIRNLIAYADGNSDLVQLAETIEHQSPDRLVDLVRLLVEKGVLTCSTH